MSTATTLPRQLQSAYPIPTGASDHSVGAFEIGKANTIAFSTGWGDGAYGSWWGLRADGKPCCLVSDFHVLMEAKEVR